MTTTTETLTHSDCIENTYEEDCKGATEYRESLSGTGTPIPRCEHHWHLRLDREQEIREAYPDSSTPPSWFDPSYAGECWDDDY